MCVCVCVCVVVCVGVCVCVCTNFSSLVKSLVIQELANVSPGVHERRASGWGRHHATDASEW